MSIDHGPGSGPSDVDPAGAHHSQSAPPLTSVSGGATLLSITNSLCLLGGLLLLLAIAVTIISVAGRYAMGLPVPGDYELVEIICAIAIFLFFPMTHATDANLRAEFFTTALPPAGKLVLDILHDIVFLLIAALLAWRMSHGLLDKLHSGEGSLFLRIPLWWPLTVAVASMVLIAIVCAFRIAAGLGALRR